MRPEDIARLAFLLYPDLVKTDELNPESLAEKIQALRKGLQPEDEFAATVIWLGQCPAINRLEHCSLQIARGVERLRAPDFLAIASSKFGSVPLLIEVKSHHGRRLRWSAKYLQSLRAYAEAMHLPLLVAWRFGDIWTLVDHRHFKKNVTGYELSLETAFKEDLFCLLFGNLRIQMNSEIEFRLALRILDDLHGDEDTPIPPGSMHIEIKAAGFYHQGAEVTGYLPEHFSLFLTSPDSAEFVRTGKQTAQQTFRPLEEHIFSLSNVLSTQLSFSNGGRQVDWHKLFARGSLPTSGQKLRDSLGAGLDLGFINCVMNIIPQTWPSFLSSGDPRAKHSSLDEGAPNAKLAKLPPNV
jgi:Holliday junction resolvase